jgi:hypothetical protein
MTIARLYEIESEAINFGSHSEDAKQILMKSVYYLKNQ